jgi:hypothetical protein
MCIEIWYKRPSILIDKEYILEIFPSYKWSKNRNINAIFRLCSLIISVILILYAGDKSNIIKLLSAFLLLIIILVLLDMKTLGKEKYNNKEKNIKEYFNNNNNNYYYKPHEQIKRNLNIEKPQNCKVKKYFKNDNQVKWKRTRDEYPFDNRMYRKLGNDKDSGMSTCNYWEPSPNSVVDVFEKITKNTGPKKRKNNYSNSFNNKAVDMFRNTMNFNSNKYLIHDRENAYFRDQYLRNRLRATVGESNRTSDGHIYGAQQETRARKNIPESSYLDRMGIYE